MHAGDVEAVQFTRFIESCVFYSYFILQYHVREFLFTFLFTLHLVHVLFYDLYIFSRAHHVFAF